MPLNDIKIDHFDYLILTHTHFVHDANANIVANLHLVGMAAEESKETGNWAKVKDISHAT
jgi:beta-lactamase superfamily II metal-dependent hydrolase